MVRKSGMTRQRKWFDCTCCTFSTQKHSSFVLHNKEEHDIEL